jgi:hypothetical protein
MSVVVQFSARPIVAAFAGGPEIAITGARGPIGPAGPFSRGVSLLNPSEPLALVAWRAPFSCRVTAIRGWRSGGDGAAVNAAKRGAGAHLSEPLALGAADTWLAAAGALAHADYDEGDSLELLLVSTDGAVEQVSIQVEFERI